MTYVKEKLILATNKWTLTDINVIYELNQRAVYMASSEQYGEVILKLNSGTEAITSEYHMLHAINGNCCCKVFEYDSQNGMLLEEKIVPGTKLREEPDVSKRILGFVDVFQKIHHKPNNNYKYETYLDWLDRTCAKMQTLDAGGSLADKMRMSRDIGHEMFAKYSDRMLLHGDLHHDNMLLTRMGNYAMIDPKGVIGPVIFDTPRFILNELDPDINKTGAEHIRNVIDQVSQSLHYPTQDVKRLFFMEVILGNSWCVESGEEIDLKGIEIATEMLKM